MIEKYISELLKNNERVIIPGFGAFLQSKGEIKNLIFNEFIKFNDGQLINYIAENEKVNLSEASDKLDKFVSDIKDKLKEGKSVKFKSVGELYSDDQGRIRLKTERDIDKGVSDKKVEKEDQKEEQKAEKPKEEKPEPKKTIPPKRTVAPEEKVLAGMKMAEDKHKRIVQEDPRMAYRTGEGNNEKKKKKFRAALWIPVIFIPIIAVALWVYFDYQNVKSIFIGEKDKKEQTVLAEEPKQEAEKTGQDFKNEGEKEQPSQGEKIEPVEDERKQQIDKPGKQTQPKKEPEPEVTKEPEKESIKTPAKPAKKYHLIAGAYSVKENAENLVSKLKDKGFYAEIIGKIKDLYYVSYNSYETRQDAMYELQRLTDKGYDTWLYYY